MLCLYIYIYIVFLCNPYTKAELHIKSINIILKQMIKKLFFLRTLGFIPLAQQSLAEEIKRHYCHSQCHRSQVFTPKDNIK